MFLIEKLTSSKDIPAHTYQATFEPNKEWSQFYASAKEILQYWKRVARKYGAMKYIKLKRKVVEARWDEENAKWLIKVRIPVRSRLVNSYCSQSCIDSRRRQRLCV